MLLHQNADSIYVTLTFYHFYFAVVLRARFPFLFRSLCFSTSSSPDLLYSFFSLSTLCNDVRSHLIDSSYYCQMLSETRKKPVFLVSWKVSQRKKRIVNRPPYSNNSMVFFSSLCGCALCVLSVFTLHFISLECLMLPQFDYD